MDNRDGRENGKGCFNTARILSCDVSFLNHRNAHCRYCSFVTSIQGTFYFNIFQVSVQRVAYRTVSYNRIPVLVHDI